MSVSERVVIATHNAAFELAQKQRASAMYIVDQKPGLFGELFMKSVWLLPPEENLFSNRERIGSAILVDLSPEKKKTVVSGFSFGKYFEEEVLTKAKKPPIGVPYDIAVARRKGPQIWSSEP